MSSATASTGNLRIVSRRAHALMQKHIEAKKTPASAPPPHYKVKDHLRNAETPWPKSIRYTFFTACAAAVPFSIGSAIAMSPRLRDSLADDTDPDVTTNKIVHLVRQYWGSYDYLPPVDRPPMNHVLPGRRLKWQEDNWSSFLAAMGLYTSREGGSTIDILNPNDEIPISLDNEPPANIRHEKSLLARYLSPEYNSSGVNARLSLIPCDMIVEYDNTCHEFECKLPPNASLLSVRNIIGVSNSSDAIQKLESLFPGASCLRSSREGVGWAMTYRLALDFNNVLAAQELVGHSSADYFESSSGTDSEVINSQSNQSPNMLLRHTSIHSSWSYFPYDNSSTTSKATSSKVPAATRSSEILVNNIKDLKSERIEQLKYQISTLEKSLSDPSSLRDRDDMYAELKLAKQELSGIKPKWWKRIWA